MAGRLDAVGIIVRDLKVSVPFYRALGLPFPDGAEEAEHGHAEAELGGGFRLMLDSEASIAQIDPGWRPAGDGDPRVAIALRCEAPAGVDELFAAGVGAGARPRREPWDAFWGQRYAIVDDPDGNHVSIFAELK